MFLMEAITMSRESDRLMMKLPVADVADWLRAEMRDMGRNGFSYYQLEVARTLISKLGQDEDTKGEDE
jgi:hypothetical protein